jgi:hypothetical protein
MSCGKYARKCCTRNEQSPILTTHVRCLPVCGRCLQAEIVLFGGQLASVDCASPTMTKASVHRNVASRTVYRLRVNFTGSGTAVQYTFGTWQKEDMGIRRVGGHVSRHVKPYTLPVTYMRT